jgi:hypothetical protein
LPREYEVHDLMLLLNRSALENILRENQRAFRQFRRVESVWGVELRYQGRLVSASEAREFFGAWEGILEWLRAQISKRR